VRFERPVAALRLDGLARRLDETTRARFERSVAELR
jgi:hypothetical protein